MKKKEKKTKRSTGFQKLSYVTVVDWKIKWTFVSSGVIGCRVGKSGMGNHGDREERRN